MESKNYYKKTTFWIPLLISVLIFGIGDVLLKQGNIDIGSAFQRLLEGEFWLALATSAPIIAGFGCALLAKLVMGLVLSKNPLATSEGLFLAFSVVMVFIMGTYFFNEVAGPTSVVGLVLIVIGIFLVYFPHSQTELDENTSEELGL